MSRTPPVNTLRHVPSGLFPASNPAGRQKIAAWQGQGMLDLESLEPALGLEVSSSGCQASGFVEAGLPGASGFRLGLADGLLTDVVGAADPGGLVLGGRTHVDDGVTHQAREISPCRFRCQTTILRASKARLVCRPMEASPSVVRLWPRAGWVRGHSGSWWLDVDPA